jgi:hypothetical protein
VDRWDAQLDVVLRDADEDQAAGVAAVLGGRPVREGPDVRVTGSVIVDAHDPGAAVTSALRSVNARLRSADPDWRHQLLIEVTIGPHWPGAATG